MVPAILADSGGPSLLLLTEVLPAFRDSWLLSESGNMRNRLLASAGGSKWSLRVTAHDVYTAGMMRTGVMCPYSALRAPPIKYSGGQKSDFAEIHEAEILYRV